MSSDLRAGCNFVSPAFMPSRSASVPAAHDAPEVCVRYIVRRVALNADTASNAFIPLYKDELVQLYTVLCVQLYEQLHRRVLVQAVLVRARARLASDKLVREARRGVAR